MGEEELSPGARRAPVTPPGARLAVGFSCLLLTYLTLGSFWPLLRAGVLAMPPMWFGAVRLWMATAVMFTLLFLFGRLRQPTRQDLPVILSVGVFMLGIYVTLAQLGMQYVGAGRATLLGYTTPLWILPFAIVILRERLTVLRAMGLLLGLAGLLVLFNPIGFDWSDHDVVMGNGMLLLAAMSWGVCIIQMRTQVYRLEPLQLAPWQLLVAASCLLFSALMIEPAARIDYTTRNITLLVMAGPVGTCITIWSVTMTMRHLPAVTSSSGLLGVPVVSTLVAWVFLDEPLTWTLGIGLVVIIAGIAMVSLGEARRCR